MQRGVPQLPATTGTEPGAALGGISCFSCSSPFAHLRPLPRSCVLAGGEGGLRESCWYRTSCASTGSHKRLNYGAGDATGTHRHAQPGCSAEEESRWGNALPVHCPTSQAGEDQGCWIDADSFLSLHPSHTAIPAPAAPGAARIPATSAGREEEEDALQALRIQALKSVSKQSHAPPGLSAVSTSLCFPSSPGRREGVSAGGQWVMGKGVGCFKAGAAFSRCQARLLISNQKQSFETVLKVG